MNTEVPARIVITLHGVHTTGAWQKHLTPDLQEAGFIHEPLDYGFVWVLMALFAWFRNRKVKWFLEKYTDVLQRHPDHVSTGQPRVSIIGHSFGTYILTTAMQTYQEVKFDRIILCGSIVRRDYPWPTFVAGGQARHVLHDYGRLDWVSRLAEYGIRDAGSSGRNGFENLAGGAVIQRHHQRFRHSDYFYRLNYLKNWLPFLKGENVAETIVLEKAKTNWRFWLLRSALALTVLGGIIALIRSCAPVVPTLDDWKQVRAQQAGALPPEFTSIADAIVGRRDPLFATVRADLENRRAAHSYQHPTVDHLTFESPLYPSGTLPKRVSASVPDIALGVFVIGENGALVESPQAVDSDVELALKPETGGSALRLVVMVFPISAAGYQAIRNSMAPAIIRSK